jgi:hypothetical protein
MQRAALPHVTSAGGHRRRRPRSARSGAVARRRAGPSHTAGRRPDPSRGPSRYHRVVGRDQGCSSTTPARGGGRHSGHDPECPVVRSPNRSWSRPRRRATDHRHVTSGPATRRAHRHVPIEASRRGDQASSDAGVAVGRYGGSAWGAAGAAAPALRGGRTWPRSGSSSSPARRSSCRVDRRRGLPGRRLSAGSARSHPPASNITTGWAAQLAPPRGCSFPFRRVTHAA